MDPYDIGIYGGGTLGTLGGIGAYQTLSDMNAINKMAAMGNYSSLNPMPQEFMNKLKGAWTPSSTFQKTGYPTGLKNWFFSRSSPQHFGPVERMMNWGRAGLPYLKQGAKFLRRSPLYGAASDVLFGTDITASSVKDINKLLGVSTEKEEAAKKAAEEEAARRAAAAAKAAALAGGAAGASTSSGGGQGGGGQGGGGQGGGGQGGGGGPPGQPSTGPHIGYGGGSSYTRPGASGHPEGYHWKHGGVVSLMNLLNRRL